MEQIARYVLKNHLKFLKTGIDNFLLLLFMMYKLHIYQDEYGELYDRRYPITIIMPNNGEKENNIPKNQLICDIVNNTHNKF